MLGSDTSLVTCKVHRICTPAGFITVLGGMYLHLHTCTVSYPTLCAALLDHHYRRHHHHHHYHHHYPTTTTTTTTHVTRTLLNLLAAQYALFPGSTSVCTPGTGRSVVGSFTCHIIITPACQKHRPALLNEEPAPPEACGAGAAAGDNLVSQISY